MKRLSALIATLTLFAASGIAVPAKKPKLILTIVIDQFRYDYLTRFRSEYKGGLARLLDHGAVFTSAYYEHFPPLTAIGHSTVLSGATPALSGIVGNEWTDRDTWKEVTSVSDDRTHIVGGSERCRRLTAPVACQHCGRSIEDGQQRADQSDRCVHQGPQRHSAGRAHGQCRLLVRAGHGKLRKQRLLLRKHAVVGREIQR